MTYEEKIQWCIDQHKNTNHFYDKYLPYEFHLRMVARVCEQFKHLIKTRYQQVLDEQCELTTKEPVINRKLKEIALKIGIGKKLSSHCARKTFAVTMCLGHGIQSDVACELMGITLPTFIKAYRKITPENILLEVRRAWG